MQYTTTYLSPVGEILIVADETGLVGLWFDGEKYYAGNLKEKHEQRETGLLLDTKCWLDVYFSGKEPDFMPPMHVVGTDFQKEVWSILQTIPYGKTMTYGEIAREIAKKRGIKRMSAQAVGNAVGRNPLSLLIPCHRVIGWNGNLTGYAGGIDKKIAFLKLEGAWKEAYFVPKQTTAP
jgi:methylated-DNA-[protein]-cysteine S-methyltransferase